MENIKTPVAFLIECLAENGIVHSSDINKANEMFKEQIIEAYDQHRCVGNFESGNQYYNETYSK